MDHAIFLNSSGGIVTPYGNGYYIPALHIAPYVEQVALPVLTVDSAALYGDRPERFVTLTHSTAAALTFFVDGVAGGKDKSILFKNGQRIKTIDNNDIERELLKLCEEYDG